MGKQIMNGIVYGGVGKEYLSNLSDVELTNLQDGQGLLYDSALQKWVNAVVGSGGSGSGGAVGIRDVTSLISLHPGVAQNPDVNNFTYKAWQIGNTVFLHARGNLVGFSNPAGILYSMLDIDPSISPQEVYDGYALGGGSTTQRIRADTDNTIKISGIDNAGYAWIGAAIYWRVDDTYYAACTSPEIYSFEEREVGVWTDGKPLYEKTIHINSLPSVAFQSTPYPHNIENIDVICNYYGVARFSNGVVGPVGSRIYISVYPAPSYMPVAYSWSIMCSKTNVEITVAEDRSSMNADITIQYTKTTDVPGSGHYTTNGSEAHHYSTEEQVVGTWLDGKTLYEKTVDCGALPNNGTKNVNHNIANLKRIINFSGCAYRSVGDIVNIPLPYVGNNSNLNTVLYVGSTIIGITTFSDRSAFTESYVTLQYTKTTD